MTFTHGKKWSINLLDGVNMDVLRVTRRQARHNVPYALVVSKSNNVVANVRSVIALCTRNIIKLMFATIGVCRVYRILPPVLVVVNLSTVFLRTLLNYYTNFGMKFVAN